MRDNTVGRVIARPFMGTNGIIHELQTGKIIL